MRGEGGDVNTWPLRLPMTKAAVRAMDAVTAIAKTKGATVRSLRSLRCFSSGGWTTWTTAAVDKRVVADHSAGHRYPPNFEKALNHHYSVYGAWAPSLADYTEMKIFDWIGTSQLKKLDAIEDPYSYISRLTMPKYIINSGGDQYFLPDSSQSLLERPQGRESPSATSRISRSTISTVPTHANPPAHSTLPS